MKLRALMVMIALTFLVSINSCVNRAAKTETQLDSSAVSQPKMIPDAISPTPLIQPAPPSISGEIPSTSNVGNQEATPESESQYLNPGGPGSSNELDNLVLEAKEDLARRLGIASDQVTLLSIIRQEFTAGGFSCRTEKERIARDTLPEGVEGYSILLGAETRSYEYHANDMEVLFCRALMDGSP